MRSRLASLGFLAPVAFAATYAAAAMLSRRSVRYSPSRAAISSASRFGGTATVIGDHRCLRDLPDCAYLARLPHSASASARPCSALLKASGRMRLPTCCSCALRRSFPSRSSISRRPCSARGSRLSLDDGGRDHSRHFRLFVDRSRPWQRDPHADRGLSRLSGERRERFAVSASNRPRCYPRDHHRLRASWRRGALPICSGASARVAAMAPQPEETAVATTLTPIFVSSVPAPAAFPWLLPPR